MGFRHPNRKLLLAAILVLMVFYLVFLSDYPEEIVEVDQNFKLDTTSEIFSPGMKFKSVWPTESHQHLQRGLKQEEYRELVDLLEVFAELMRKNNITLVMMDGTLLGSYFFHDFVPWDDDLDLMVSWEDRAKVFKVFSDHKLRETYDVCTYQDTINWYSLETLEGRNPKLQKPSDREYYTNRADFKFKFFRKDSKQAGEYEWKWPFVDIKYFRVTGDKVNKVDNHKEYYSLDRQDFFPFHLRPFAHLWLPAPRDTRAVLRKKYQKFTCVSHDWDHVREVSQSRLHVSCHDILDIYPHVHRTRLIEAAGKAHVVESLVRGSRILHSVKVDEPWYNVSGYYDLQ